MTKYKPYAVMVKEKKWPKEVIFKKGLRVDHAEKQAENLNRLKGLSARIILESELENHAS